MQTDQVQVVPNRNATTTLLTRNSWQIEIVIPSNKLWEELVEREADGATEEHEECEEMELAAHGVAWGGVPARVAAEVKETSDDVDEAEESRKARVLEAAHEEHGEEDGQELEAVLVASLNTIELLCVLVFALEGVHRRVGHIELLTSHPDLKLYTQIINMTSFRNSRTAGAVQAFHGAIQRQKKVWMNSFVTDFMFACGN